MSNTDRATKAILHAHDDLRESKVYTKKAQLRETRTAKRIARRARRRLCRAIVADSHDRS